MMMRMMRMRKGKRGNKRKMIKWIPIERIQLFEL